MVPSIAQQLQSLSKALAETIIPALPEDAGFAREQAGLSLATLGWLADVQAHAYRWEVAENAEYRALLQELAALDAGGSDGVRELLATPPPPAHEALPAPEDLAAQNAALKEESGRLFTQLAGADGETRERATQLLSGVSQRQSTREQAWFRMTGFTGSGPGVGDVLRTA